MSHDDNFSRRTLFLGVSQLAFFALLTGRLYQLQLLDSEEYYNLAEGNRIRLVPIMPERGNIYDRFGSLLAQGMQKYDLYYSVDGAVGDIEEVIKLAQRLLEWGDEEADIILGRAKKAEKDKPSLLKKNLPWEKMAIVEAHSSELRGIEISSPKTRNYPFGQFTAHILGYTSKPSQLDIENRPGMQKVLSRPEARVGKTGIEKRLEQELFGKPGVRHIEADFKGAYVKDLKMTRPEAGRDVNLTIDSDLQKFVMETLAGKGGVKTEGASTVVMDATNGEILAIGSVPSYDPNRFVEGVDQKYWDQLLKNTDKPMINKAVSAAYPPGSTFKLVVAMAALKHGLVDINTEHYCPGFFDFGDRYFHCWERRGHGKMNLWEAIAQSCNVFFYKVGVELGIERISAMAKELGLGDLTGIELMGEVSGIVPNSQWKRSALGQPWYPGETVNAAIGQGYASSTPIQLATMAARIASGKRVFPHLIKDTDNIEYKRYMLDDGKTILLPESRESAERIDISPWHLDLVHKGMAAATNNIRGTVYRSRIDEDGIRFAGKTGTSQVVAGKKKGVKYRRNEKHHALFVGFAPLQKPKYAISVVVEHGGYGSASAAPIAKEILYKIQTMHKPKKLVEEEVKPMEPVEPVKPYEAEVVE